MGVSLVELVLIVFNYSLHYPGFALDAGNVFVELSYLINVASLIGCILLVLVFLFLSDYLDDAAKLVVVGHFIGFKIKYVAVYLLFIF
jgi:hypothetical protein